MICTQAPPHDDHATAHRDGGDAVAATLVGCRALLFSLFLLRYARYPLDELPAGWTRARLSFACLAPLVLAWASLVDHVSRAVLVSAITDPKPDLVDRALERANAAARDVSDRAGQESEIPNFKGSYLGRFPLVSADFWTSDHLSERSRSVGAYFGTRARGTLTLKRR